MQYPEYDHSIVSVTNSIRRAFGADCRHQTLPILDERLNRGYRNVVLMLFDGMGVDALERHLPEDSFLRTHVADTVSSVFPSTTTAALTSLETGLTPCEHGWLGWNLYIKEIDKIVDLFPNTVKDTDGVQAAEVHMARTYLPFERIMAAIERAGQGRMIMISPFSDIRVTNQDELFAAVQANCGEPGRKFIYAYWNQPDSLMHRTGSGSAETKEAIQRIDRSVQALCESLTDTLLVVIADHGHLDTRYHYISDYPELVETLIRPISIESRAAAFYVKEHCKQGFPELFRKIFGADYLLFSKKEVLEKGLFGSGVCHPRFQESIGDFLAVAVSDAAMVSSHESKQFISNHAGLTEAEMRVPLIIIEKPAQ